ARGHAEAFTEELEVDGVTVASRTKDKAEVLASYLRTRGVETDVVEPGTSAFTEALLGAQIVVTATTSTTPVITGTLRQDASVFAVGAYRSEMAELSPAVVATARRVVVDTLAGARHEAGELIDAVAAGVWQWSAAVTLLDLLAAGPTLGAPAASRHHTATGSHQVFKSVGHAMYDLAAARVAFPAGQPAHATG